MDDSGILGEIGSAVGAVGAAIADEVKKVGASAGSQVTGSQPSQQVSAADDFSVVGELKKWGTSATSQVSGGKQNNRSQQESPSKSSRSTSFFDEMKKLGGSFTGQVSGKSQDEIEAMQREDSEFSEQSAAHVRAKINRIYEEYAMKKKREEEMRKQQEEQQEAQKKQIDVMKEERKDEEFTNAAIEKTRAENKNFGAE